MHRTLTVRENGMSQRPGAEAAAIVSSGLFLRMMKNNSSTPVMLSSDTCICCEASGNILDHILALIQGVNAIPRATSMPLMSGPGV